MTGTMKKRARVPRGSEASAQGSGQNVERARAARNLWKPGYHNAKQTGNVQRTSTPTPLITHQDDGVQQDDIDEYEKGERGCVPRPELSFVRNSHGTSQTVPMPQNDRSSLDRMRSAMSEPGQDVEALLRCKQQLLISTLNVNTLRNVNREAELDQCRKAINIEILGIQEHRFIHDDPIEFKKIGSSCLITSSGWRNSAQASQGGVGLLLGPKARKSLLKVRSISSRVLIAEFDGSPKTSVIVVYSPTNCADEDTVKEFYDTLRNTISDVPAHNFLVVIGDFNARLGPEQVPFTYHDSTNRNGNYMTELLAEFGLLATNTQFRKKKGKLWTFRDRATDSCRQLDYILVRQKWRNSVLNSEAYNTFNTVGSDHRVVSAKLKLSLRTSKQDKKVKFDWKQVTNSPELQNRYTVTVKNKFQVLETDDNSTRYEKFVVANKEAMRECLPVRKGKKSALRSSDPRVVRARKEAERAHLEWEADQSDTNKDTWKQALGNLYAVYDQVKEKEIEGHIRNIESAHGAQKYGEAWKVVNDITGRKNTKEGQVAGSSPQERVSTWFTSFKQLLGKNPEVENPDEEIASIFQDLDIKDGIFSLDEYRKVKSTLKLGKAAGPDDIPPEVFKSCDFDEICLDFCNKALMENDKPDMWSYMNIIPVPKSGDLSNTNNYRGISLICIIAKIYNRLILNRIRSAIDPKLRYNQNGFRPNRTTVAQILALRRIIEGVKANNLPAIITFIDFKKAFDSIHRGKMLRILKAYGIPPNLLRAIGAMYTNTRAKVISPDGETELFDITAGVLQGDTLAPFLFVIVLDYALRKAMAGKEEELGFTITPRKSRRHPKDFLADLDFADDIALLSDEMEQAQQLLSNVESECQKVGLGLNGPKTKFLAYNIVVKQPLHTNDGTVLEQKDDMKYLGSMVDSSEKDISIRKAQAWRALNNMSTIWNSNMDPEVKKKFFIAAIESILLYGCEAWTLTQSQEKSLDGTYTRMLRRAMNIHWSSKTTNKELYGKLPAVSDKIASRRLQLAGHCQRHPELAAHRLILWEPTHGHRRRGRPAMTFVDTLKRDTGASETSELATLMADRRVWKNHVKTRLRSP